MLLTWWNLVFIVPFGLALLYLVLYTVSGITFGDDLSADASGGGVDAEHDIHFDGEAHVDAEASGGVDTDADADASGPEHEVHDGHHDHGHAGTGRTALAEAMTWLGLGKAPISILLMVMFMAWGLTGFFINAGLWPAMGGLVPLVSLPAAVVMSFGLTHLVGRLFARYMPPDAGAAPRRSSLVGREGEAIFNIDQKFGMVVVRDRQGEVFQLPCRIYQDRDPIRKGDKVLLVDYDKDQQMFYVTRSELGAQQ
jgi:membrane protein implicated in regulation of membrane protease activity